MTGLEDLRVLVTGGSRGIGAATCRAFGEAGAHVAIHYHQEEDAATGVLEDLPVEGEHLLVAADLGERQQVAAMLDRIRSEWGALDCLVNNAGIWLRDPIGDLDEASLDATLDLNVRGVFYCVRESLALLRESRRASIVNVSSTAAQRGEARHSPYAASKGAIIAATKSWATELAPQIRVNAVAPGWVDTDMSRESLEGPRREDILSEIPLGRVATAGDIAAPIVFLASSAARHITGEILNVNGGSVLAG